MSVWTITKSDLDTAVRAANLKPEAVTIHPDSPTVPGIVLADQQSTALLTFELAAVLTAGMPFDTDLFESEYDILALAVQGLSDNEQIITDAQGWRVVFWPDVTLGETTERVVTW